MQTAGRHAERQRTLSRQGLARLTQIAILIMVGAVLAMAVAMGTMVWQRRPRLASAGLVLAAAVAAIALPAYLAAGVSPAVALQD